MLSEMHLIWQPDEERTSLRSRVFDLPHVDVSDVKDDQASFELSYNSW